MVEAFNTGNPGIVDEIVSPEVVSFSPHPLPANQGAQRERIKREMLLPRTAFPDQHFEIQVLIAEGDLVFLGWKFTGTQLGPMGDGSQPTGRQVTVYGGEIARLKDGIIVEHLDHFTKPRLEMMSQLRLLTPEKQDQLRNRGMIP